LNTRIWRTYADKSVILDSNMVEDSSLVKAGLFSAIVSTFVAQASQSLSADYTQMSASFLFELVAIRRALRQFDRSYLQRRRIRASGGCYGGVRCISGHCIAWCSALSRSISLWSGLLRDM
ncbi:hypothetical protein IW262DRAFT_1266563, partial [Armillaria fumosa]